MAHLKLTLLPRPDWTDYYFNQSIEMHGFKSSHNHKQRLPSLESFCSCQTIFKRTRASVGVERSTKVIYFDEI